MSLSEMIKRLHDSGKKFIRTCQECGHKQEDTEPDKITTGITWAFEMRKCKKCKSEGLDYGSWQFNKPDEDENE
jgi:DNA-directed RNA polymerase subunit M/transcription elongation factor TFIIS